MKKNLIIVAHPNYDKYSVNTKAIIEEIKNKSVNTDIHFLPENGMFDVKKEQEILLKYDVITFAFPLWWYTTPWTLKKYFDEVMTAGFGFSFRGNIEEFKLRGKKFSYIVSVGNVTETYKHDAGNLMPIEEYQNWLKGSFHLFASGWTANGGRILDESEYMIKPIICHGAAVGSAKPLESAKEYLERIDNEKN